MVGALGWKCPQCEQIYSPWVSRCLDCAPKDEPFHKADKSIRDGNAGDAGTRSKGDGGEGSDVD